jgi:hypothetical protein
MTNEQREELDRKIDAGIKAAIARAIEEHRRMGRSIVIWRDGKITTIPPEDIPPLSDAAETTVVTDQETPVER